MGWPVTIPRLHNPPKTWAPTACCLPQAAEFLKGEGSGEGRTGERGEVWGRGWAISLLAMLHRAEARKPEEPYVPALRLDGEGHWDTQGHWGGLSKQR